MTTSAPKTIAIIGAGPVGLAAAAHALERGLTPIVLESGPAVGHAIRQWAHIRLFSPWRFNIDKAAQRLLERTGWNAPEPDAFPTGAELVRNYLEPLANTSQLKDCIRTRATVVAVARTGFDKVKSRGREQAAFQIRIATGSAARSTVTADAVVDASGTWFTPNPAGGNGLQADGETELAGRIAYGMPDVLDAQRQRYAGKTVAVLGAGHSAAGTLIDLVRLADEAPATKVVWLVRGDTLQKSFGGGINDQLSARGELGSVLAGLVANGRLSIETSFRVNTLSDRDGLLRIGTASACCGRHVLADELIVATGFRPDFGFLSEIRLAHDPALDCPPALAPLIDPNEHSCGTVRPHGAAELAQPEHGFYLAGMKSYGRAPTFLMLTGYEQVRSIVADIAGDTASAARVELVLPATGVCSRAPATAADACCGAPAIPEVASPCCDASERDDRQLVVERGSAAL